MCGHSFDIDGSKLRPEGSAMYYVPTAPLLHCRSGFDHSESAAAEINDPSI
jgi:hypothetical protein